MGRPAGPPENVRKNRAVVMLTDSEIAKLNELAKSAGKPVGTVAYELLSRALKRAK